MIISLRRGWSGSTPPPRKRKKRRVSPPSTPTAIKNGGESARGLSLYLGRRTVYQRVNALSQTIVQQRVELAGGRRGARFRRLVRQTASAGGNCGMLAAACRRIAGG